MLLNFLADARPTLGARRVAPALVRVRSQGLALEILLIEVLIILLTLLAHGARSRRADAEVLRVDVVIREWLMIGVVLLARHLGLNVQHVGTAVYPTRVESDDGAGVDEFGVEVNHGNLRGIGPHGASLIIVAAVGVGAAPDEAVAKAPEGVLLVVNHHLVNLWALTAALALGGLHIPLLAVEPGAQFLPLLRSRVQPVAAVRTCPRLQTDNLAILHMGLQNLERLAVEAVDCEDLWQNHCFSLAVCFKTDGKSGQFFRVCLVLLILILTSLATATTHASTCSCTT